MQKSTIVASLLACSSPLAAETEVFSLICQNPRQEYAVEFLSGNDLIQLGSPGSDTTYRVLAEEETVDRHVVVALTTENGPTARLHLRPYQKMEFWTGDQLFQTDGCYGVNQ